MCLTGLDSLMAAAAETVWIFGTTRNPKSWVFDGYLMAERKSRFQNADNGRETLVNKGCRVFDRYLMDWSVASRHLSRKPLDKMTPNQPIMGNRIEPFERLNPFKAPFFKSLAFDQRRPNQPVSFGSNVSNRRRHVHECGFVHGDVNTTQQMKESCASPLFDGYLMG